MSQTAIDWTAAERAIDRAEAHANDEWKVAAHEAVRRCATMFRDFTTDEVWGLLTTSGKRTHEPRALGAIMVAATRKGLIEKIGYRTSADPTCHHRPKAIYRKATR